MPIYSKHLITLPALLLSLASSFSSHAYQAEVSQRTTTQLLSYQQSFQLLVDITSSDLTQNQQLQLELDFSGPLDISQLPDNCQQINDQQVDCSVSLLPHDAAETSTLAIDLTTNERGQLTATATLSNSNNQDDDLSDNKNIWLGYSTETLVKPAQFGDTQAIVAYDPDKANGPDIAITYLDSNNLGYGRTYLNNGQGSLSIPENNEYFIGALAGSHAISIINNDDIESTPELFFHGQQVLLHILKAGALPFSIYREAIENSRVPANTPLYADIDPLVQTFFLHGLGKPRKIIFDDIDSDQGEDANNGYEHLYITRTNDGVHLLYYSYSNFNNINRPSIQLTTSNTFDGVFADLNNDNRLDIILAQSTTNHFWLAEDAPMVNRFPNSVGIGSAVTSQAVAAMDTDRDGDIDLIFSDDVILNNLPSKQLSIYLNDGSANFTKSPQSITTAEVDQLLTTDIYNEGYDSLLVSQFGQLSIYKSSAEGLVYSPLSIQIKAPLVLADFDQDGLMDIAGDRVYFNTEVIEPSPIVVSIPPTPIPDPIVTPPPVVGDTNLYPQFIGSGSFQGYAGIASLFVLIITVLVRVKKSNNSTKEISTNE